MPPSTATRMPRRLPAALDDFLTWPMVGIALAVTLALGVLIGVLLS